jgi:uncharacterized protein (TIGR00730 family)
MQYSSVAVFCGSKLGNDPLYEQHARELGKLLGQRGIQLVYGGGNVGLMGAVANAAMEAGGRVIGVIPDVLVQWERQHTGLTTLHVVADMHIRKKMMYDLCDAAIVLPGGHGTLDELFETLTWNTLNIHDKKIILLNSAGYYNHLIGHINHTQLQGFLHEDWRSRFEVYNTPLELISDWDAGKY